MYGRCYVGLCACILVFSLTAVSLQSLCEGSCEACLSLDPVADLAGLLVPSLGILYAMPDHAEGVLQALDAVTIGESTYQVEIECWFVIKFSAELVDYSPICGEGVGVWSSSDLAGDLAGLSIPCLESVFAIPRDSAGISLSSYTDTDWSAGGSYQVQIKCSYLLEFSVEFIDYPAIVPIAKPDLVEPDDTIRVYKDADCKKIREGSRSPCVHCKKLGPKYENYVVEWKTLYSCVKGHGYCVERKVISTVFHYYYDCDCEQEYDSKNIMGWSCMP
jgi:hypothetical protein